MTRLSLIAALIAFPLTAFAEGHHPGPTPEQVRPAKTKVKAPVEVEMGAAYDRPTVQVMFGDKGPFKFIVDSGAAKLILPQSVVDKLGLTLGREIVVRYADGRTAHRREAEAVYLEMLGRHSTFSAIVEPQRETASIGAIVLEDLDLLVDCQQQRVIPRDPDRAIYEVE